MPRAPKICSWPAGCPNTAERGTNRCGEHRKIPWAGSNRSRDTGTAAWKRLRLAVLNRDGRQCRLRLPGCLGIATECDHIRPRYEFARLEAADVPENCQAVCKRCHAKRSASQGGRAAFESRRAADGGVGTATERPRRRVPRSDWTPRPPIRSRPR